MPVKATYNGFTLLGLKSTVISITSGVNPSYIEIDVDPADAEILLKQKLSSTSPGELRIDDGSGGTKTGIYKPLFVLHELPSEYKEVSRLLLADHRWIWPRLFVTINANIRRRIGNKRLTSPTEVEEIQQTVEEIGYAKWSKNGEKLYTAKDILREILKQIADYMQKNFSMTFSYSFETDDIDWDKYPVQDVEINDPANEAITRIFDIVPDIGITLNTDGDVFIYSKRNRAPEKEVIDATIDREIYGAGFIKRCSMARLRPKEVHVYFEREVELRIDAQEGDTTFSRGFRTMDNVAPIPDFQLTVTGQVLCNGTYVRFPVLLDAFGDFPGQFRKLTVRDVQICSVPFNDLWTFANMHGEMEPDVDWGGRISAIERNYRTLYRVDPALTDRIKQYRPYRLGNIDPTTGTRGGATVYSNYSRYASNRSKIKDYKSGNQEGNLCMNYIGYPASGKLADFGKPSAPAKLVIEDNDQGILRLDFQNDVNKMHIMTFPSCIELDGQNTPVGSLPTKPAACLDVTQRSSPLGFNMLFDVDVQAFPKLTTYDKKAVILTTIPAAPNNKFRFQKVVIKPDRVKKYLENMGDQLENCQGPIVEVYVGGNVTTAQVVWTDTDECVELIEKLYGFNNDGPPIDQEGADTLSQQLIAAGLLINAGKPGETSAPNDLPALQGVAEAYAAVVYASYADKDIGRAQIPMAPNLNIRGYLDEITHALDARGVITTTVNAPESAPKISANSLLDRNARRVINKLAF